ncbi:MAG TPA: YbhB/YbcL family Raf kinase inhibitor-like protein [Steroidobacteraceae bacterium]|jgi:Raf kinase inhibitor-like YbhB/YbcL family protein|nr:YbhB/YbcL family Raf kinase inhibitor-like protein [Steroidobacteraceae bacterium]
MKIRHAATIISAFLAAAALRPALAAEFQLTSTDIGQDVPLSQDFVFSGFGCTGGNQSPELRWNGAPAGTKSYAVALFDPDAMQGRGFWHWLMVNIPAGTTSLRRDAGKNDGSKLPSGAAQIRNGFRVAGYSGSCPPPADEPHGYVMTVYALKVAVLEVPDDATSPMMLAVIEANTLGKASLTYHFGRKPR